VVGFQGKWLLHTVKHLIDDHKPQYRGISPMHLTCYADQEQQFVQCTGMRDQTWVNHATPPPKTSITCKYPLLLPVKKFKATPSVRTTLPAVLRDYKGVHVVYSLDHDTTVFAEGYHRTLERLGDIICPKRLGLLCQGIFILHDTAIWTCDRWE
jgi:hypothetical protein